MKKRMKLLIKILLFVFVALVANVKVASATITFTNVQQFTTSNSFHTEIVAKAVFKISENDEENCCQNEQDLVDYRKWDINVEATAAKDGGELVDNVAKQAKNWLGKDYKVITNKAGDQIFMSKDGLRKIRFDIKNTHGDKPHIHLEEFVNGKWQDAVLGTHRIYPKP